MRGPPHNRRKAGERQRKGCSVNFLSSSSYSESRENGLDFPPPENQAEKEKAKRLLATVLGERSTKEKRLNVIKYCFGNPLVSDGWRRKRRQHALLHCQ